MPILYPSQSPISTAQLTQILPWRPSRANKLILGLLPITITIIVFELIQLYGANILDEYIVISIIGILASVVFTAFRYGAYAGFIGSIAASAYTAYIISPPESLFSYSQNTLINLVVVCLLYIGLALATGYLRG